MALHGNLETILEDGLISGWCWDPAQPTQRVRLAVVVGNETVGFTTADVFRADLEAAGIGDGCFAFSFLLPWSTIAAHSVSTVRVCDAETREPMGGALTFRRSSLLPVEQRLAGLEQSVRLLEARLAETDARAEREAGLTRSLFGAIGRFFTELGTLPVEAIGQTSLPAIAPLAHISSQHPPFALALPAAPRMTLCLLAKGPLAQTYATLAALHASGVDRAAEILLLDASGTGEQAILPSLIENLRCWRIPPGESPMAALGQAAALGERDLLALLPDSAQPTAEWLAAVCAAFDGEPACAALACRILSPDGVVQASGLLPDRAGRLADFAFGEPAAVPRINRTLPVAATGATGFVLRRAVFQALDGFDPGFAEPAAAMTDFCLRAWEAGHRVLYRPGCTLQARAPGGGCAIAAADPGLATLLAERWERLALRHLPLASGHALIIDETTADGIEPILAQAALLQSLGFTVSFGAAAGLEADPMGAAQLRDAGLIVLRAPYQPSIAEALKAAQPPFALAELSARAAHLIAPETLRLADPALRILLRLDPAAAAVLAGDEPTPEREQLSKIALGCDGVIAERGLTPALFGAEASAAAPVLFNLTPPGATARQNLWLILDGTAETAAETDAWLATLLPAIAKALPKCQLHTMRRTGRTLPKGITQHAPSRCDAALLSKFRLALAPFRQPGADAEAIAAALAAALPVLATLPALGDATPAPGIATTTTKDTAVTRQLVALMGNDAAWTTLAAPLLTPRTGAAAATAYATMLDQLRRPR